MERVRLTRGEDLDRLIFETIDPLADSEQIWAHVKSRAIQDAIDWHAERCPRFGRLLERRDYRTGPLVSEADFARVPVFPARVFKRAAVVSQSDEEIAQVFKSSGTSGAQSFVARDGTTLLRLLGSMRLGVALIREPDRVGRLEEEVMAIHLGPTAAQAEGVWFLYIMALIEQIVPTVHCGAEGESSCTLAVDHLRGALQNGLDAVLVGSPARVLRLCEHVVRTGQRLGGGSRLFVITGGGWKTRTDLELDRQCFADTVTQALGLQGAQQVRDAFNQVELNTVILECKAGRKHVPPWLEVIARDPSTLEALPRGQVGVLSFLDPTARSFPCFIAGDDFGRVHAQQCVCGRATRTMEVIRRIHRGGHQGCAAELERRFAEVEVKRRSSC